MKTPITMYGIAKARALQNSPMSTGNMAGYGLTRKELRMIFYLNSFTHEKTIEKQIKVWENLNLVQSVGQVVFFYLNTNDPNDINRMILLEATCTTTETWKNCDIVGFGDCVFPEVVA